MGRFFLGCHRQTLEKPGVTSGAFPVARFPGRKQAKFRESTNPITTLYFQHGRQKVKYRYTVDSHATSLQDAFANLGPLADFQEAGGW